MQCVDVTFYIQTTLRRKGKRKSSVKSGLFARSAWTQPCRKSGACKQAAFPPLVGGLAHLPTHSEASITRPNGELVLSDDYGRQRAFTSHGYAIAWHQKNRSACWKTGQEPKRYHSTHGLSSVLFSFLKFWPSSIVICRFFIYCLEAQTNNSQKIDGRTKHHGFYWWINWYVRSARKIQLENPLIRTIRALSHILEISEVKLLQVSLPYLGAIDKKQCVEG